MKMGTKFVMGLATSLLAIGSLVSSCTKKGTPQPEANPVVSKPKPTDTVQIQKTASAYFAITMSGQSVNPDDSLSVFITDSNQDTIAAYKQGKGVTIKTFGAPTGALFSDSKNNMTVYSATAADSLVIIDQNAKTQTTYQPGSANARIISQIRNGMMGNDDARATLETGQWAALSKREFVFGK
jgi:hypothetical protein